MAKIIEFESERAAPPVRLDVSERVSEFMYAFHLLDHAELRTSSYNFDSRWQQGCRTWTLDGVEVDREDFEEHLTAWLRERAQRRFGQAAVVLPMATCKPCAR